MKNLVTVEWSESQKCFHVDTAERTCLKNLNAFKNHRECDYVLINLCANDNEALKFTTALRELQEYKDKFK